MKSKRNLDVMKETLSEKFKEYIFSLDADEMHNFLHELESTNLLSYLSENCKPIELPAEVFRCAQCEKIYGDCERESEKAKDPYLVCKKRFYSYCETPVAKQ